MYFKKLGSPITFEFLKYIIPKLTSITKSCLLYKQPNDGKLTPTDNLTHILKAPVISHPTQNSKSHAMAHKVLHVLTHVFLFSFLSQSLSLSLSLSIFSSPHNLSLFPQGALDFLLFLQVTKPPFENIQMAVPPCLPCGPFPTSLGFSQNITHSRIPSRATLTSIFSLLSSPLPSLIFLHDTYYYLCSAYVFILYLLNSIISTWRQWFFFVLFISTSLRLRAEPNTLYVSEIL